VYTLTCTLAAEAGTGGFWFQWLLTVRSMTADPPTAVLQTNGIFCGCDGLSANVRLGPQSISIDPTVNNTFEIKARCSVANANLWMLLDECFLEWLDI
jgi:hypothetical protein